jgi:hypothetical protein
MTTLDQLSRKIAAHFEKEPTTLDPDGITLVGYNIHDIGSGRVLSPLGWWSRANGSDVWQYRQCTNADRCLRLMKWLLEREFACEFQTSDDNKEFAVMWHGGNRVEAASIELAIARAVERVIDQGASK